MRRIMATLSGGAKRLFNTVDEVVAWAKSTGNVLDDAEVAECRRLTS